MLTMLIADCEPQVNDALAIHFEYKKFMVHTAWKVVRIIDILQKYKFDIIILDVKTIDGLRLDLLEKIKERNSDVKIIVMSTYLEQDEIVDKIKVMGANEYLHKPIRVADLENLVDKYMGSTKRI